MLDGFSHLSTFDARHIEKNLRARLKEWREMLHRQTPLSRQVLTRILEGEKIAWTPRPDKGIYDTRDAASLDRLLGLEFYARGSVPNASQLEPNRHLAQRD